jgi:hypothetical protein
VVVPPAAAVAAAPAFVPAPAPSPTDSEAIAKAREAVRQTIGENYDNGGPKADPAAIAKAREAVRQRVSSTDYTEPASQAGYSPAFNFPPLEGPALPISSQKQQQLSELLQRYKADQVTPEQYQTERAKILAGP